MALGRDRLDLKRIASHAGRYYESFDMQRAPDDKWRHIDNPTGELRYLQERIYGRFLKTFPFPPTMLGGIQRRSILDNAKLHLARRYLITIDIRNCFPSISNRDVLYALIRELGCSLENASLITRLTTFQTRLPQGAPTSTALANLVLLPVHDAIQDAIRGKGVICSFWIDDIALSGEFAPDILESVVEIIHRHGHRIKWSKLRAMPKRRSQSLTGVSVNQVIAAPREYRDDLRRTIRSLKTKMETPASLISRLRGQIEYVQSLRPSQAAGLEKLLDRNLDGKVLGPGLADSEVRRRCRCARRHLHEEKLAVRDRVHN